MVICIVIFCFCLLGKLSTFPALKESNIQDREVGLCINSNYSLCKHLQVFGCFLVCINNFPGIPSPWTSKFLKKDGLVNWDLRRCKRAQS